jgi:formylglycine-generating enzyme
MADLQRGTIKSCCLPRRDVDEALLVSEVSTKVPGPQTEILAGMIALPGGTFLVGTDYEEAFPNDGEGPVRAVTLSPFVWTATRLRIADSRNLLMRQKYRTEAERFGWSFVLWSHIPKTLL